MVVAVLEDGGGCACGGRWGWSWSDGLSSGTFWVVLWNVLVGVLDGLVVALFLLAAIGIVWIAWVAAHVGELTLVSWWKMNRRNQKSGVNRPTAVRRFVESLNSPSGSTYPYRPRTTQSVPRVSSLKEPSAAS